MREERGGGGGAGAGGEGGGGGTMQGSKGAEIAYLRQSRFEIDWKVINTWSPEMVIIKALC